MIIGILIVRPLVRQKTLRRRNFAGKIKRVRFADAWTTRLTKNASQAIKHQADIFTATSKTYPAFRGNIRKNRARRGHGKFYSTHGLKNPQRILFDSVMLRGILSA